MKHAARLLLPLFIFILIAGCSMFRTQQSGTLFSFEYEGETYEIAGFTNEAGESANYLTHRENENVAFRAVDHNRTGIIDQIVSGSISMLEANEIYQAGIQIAIEKDLFKNINRNRTYETKYDDYQLMVETYLKREGEFHNRFLIFNLQWELIATFWDDDSDGAIDRRESGEIEIDPAQDLYSIVLERAEESGRLIETDDSQRIIKKNLKRDKNIARVPQYKER